MWQKIKQLFKKEDEIETVDFSKLESWFDKKSKKIISEINEEIFRTNKELKLLLNQVNQKIEVLQNAQLLNPDISEREKHFLDGNKESYIKNTINLIKQIEENQLSMENHENYFKKTSQEIERFARTNLRAFQILQEFLAHESRDVGSNIRKIELLFNKQKNIFDKNNYKLINKLKQDIINVKLNIERKSKLEEDALIVEQEINDLIKKKDVIYYEIKDLESNKSLQELLKTIKETENEIKQNESEIIHIISQTEPALKKYSKITLQNQKVVEYYLLEPVKSLIEDDGLLILKIFNEIILLIKKDNIEIKDSKKEKILDLIKKLNEDSLTNLRNKIVNLKKVKKDKSKELDNLPEFILLHQKLEDLKKVNDKIEKENNYVNNLRKEIEKINPAILINNLENEFNNFMKVRIVF